MPRPNRILLTCRPFVVLCVVAKPLHTNGVRFSRSCRLLHIGGSVIMLTSFSSIPQDTHLTQNSKSVQ